VKRLALSLAPMVLAVLFPISALAADQPFNTVVDGILPTVKGLTIQGSPGGCDLLVQNQTGQNVVLFDLSKPPKPFLFAPPAKGASARPLAPVHLPAVGVWPCATLPAVTEDERWNHDVVTVGNWTINGAVGAVSFKLTGRTVYDPALDAGADLIFYARIGAGALAVIGLVFAAPYLFGRRREILGGRKKAA
jgi:hypothetical protein